MNSLYVHIPPLYNVDVELEAAKALLIAVGTMNLLLSKYIVLCFEQRQCMACFEQRTMPSFRTEAMPCSIVRF